MHTIVNPVLKMRLHPTAYPISLSRGSNLRGKPKTASTSSPTTKSSINLHPELRKTKQSPHVRESEIVLDSGFHAADSGSLPVTRFQILVSGTWIPDSLIPPPPGVWTYPKQRDVIFSLRPWPGIFLLEYLSKKVGIRLFGKKIIINVRVHSKFFSASYFHCRIIDKHCSHKIK